MAQPLNNQRACHICGQQRPRSFLSIERHKRVVPGTNRKVEEEVLYCNDKAECTRAAPRFSFMAKRKPVVASRRVRPVGE